MSGTDTNKISRASIRNLNISPRKVRLVADLIRGMETSDALAQLELLNKRSSQPLAKLLKSAIANAKTKGLDINRLVIDVITVDKGRMLKRALARGRGRVSAIQKKQSHVSLVLRESDTVQKSRFVIVEKPKSTKQPKQTAGSKKAKPDRKDEMIKKEKKPNFVKKLFQRKSV
ncbi:MAG: 50S ribosomal protein L22 [Candidatus Colwellbacteria bacterium]|nr:50S ribosomal protein L22 [Candidatus Colwellbacteria bacterium]